MSNARWSISKFINIVKSAETQGRTLLNTMTLRSVVIVQIKTTWTFLKKFYPEKLQALFMRWLLSSPSLLQRHFMKRGAEVLRLLFRRGCSGSLQEYFPWWRPRPNSWSCAGKVCGRRCPCPMKEVQIPHSPAYLEVTGNLGSKHDLSSNI